jgi:hypothetical protein
MEPQITERDLAMLLLSEEALVALGAVLGLKARFPEEGDALGETPIERLSC